MVTSSNFDEDTRTPSDPLEALVKVANPHFKYAEIDSNGYVVLDVTRGREQGDWFRVATVRQPSTAEGFTAAWKPTVGRCASRPQRGLPQRVSMQRPTRYTAGAAVRRSQTPAPNANGAVPNRLPATGGHGRVAGAAGLLAIGAALRLRLRRAVRSSSS